MTVRAFDDLKAWFLTLKSFGLDGVGRRFA